MAGAVKAAATLLQSVAVAVVVGHAAPHAVVNVVGHALVQRAEAALVEHDQQRLLRTRLKEKLRHCCSLALDPLHQRRWKKKKKKRKKIIIIRMRVSLGSDQTAAEAVDVLPAEVSLLLVDVVDHLLALVVFPQVEEDVLNVG